MLREHLIVKTRPQADPENIVFWGDYRITVLGSRLFRMEKSANKKFRDEATQAVWYRDFPKQFFTFEENNNTAVIDTGACRLILKEDRVQVCVEIEKRKVRLDNYGNLLGTYRTLDNCNGDIARRFWIPDEPAKKIELCKGVCSKTGVAVIDDSASLTLGEDGQVKNERADGTDEYVFAFGNDYREAVCALYALTGYTPLVPRYALGNWWSRYHVYTDKEYLRVLAAFEEREIPLSVATVDMDWHYSNEVNEQKGIKASGRDTFQYVGEPTHGLGWTGYSWNTELFPDYRKFLKELKKKNLKITLNLHPSDGVRWWEDMYAEMASRMGQDPEDMKCVPFDFSYDEFINAYFEILHHPYEKDGVDFWWMDWQQPDIKWHDSGEKTYDPLWALNHYHYFDNAEHHTSPLILSRYAGIGSHRYPLGFSGDTEITWKTLAYLPYFTSTASNVGYTWWSHDIGGHNFGEKNDELYLRHLQYGVFSPINRLHCACFDTMTKEPWMYGDGAGAIAEEFLRFRHALIPYLYTASYKTSVEGRALIEPLYYAWKDPQAYYYKEEYLFGGELLVAPVTSKSYPDGYARVRAWLPEGKWTDIFTGDSYEAGVGGKELMLFRKRDSIPVFAKAGAIIPLSKDKGNAYDNPEKLEVWTYTGNGEYTMYEDNKLSGGNAVLFTKFLAEYSETEGVCTQSLSVSMKGDPTVSTIKRKIAVRFKDIKNAEVSVYLDGAKVDIEEWLTDCAGAKIPFVYGKTYRIEAKFQKQSKLEKEKARAKEVLTRAEGNNRDKYEFYTELIKATSLEDYVSKIEECFLPEITKQLLKETL